jgi:protease IV
MKQFFKFLFASMFGFVLAIIVLFFILSAVVSSSISKSSDSEFTLNTQAILHLKFDQAIKDNPTDNPFSMNGFSIKSNKKLGLFQIQQQIQKAQTDQNIKAIFLDVSSLQIGYASLEELRAELENFKKSGKKIYAYCEVYSQNAYYLASVANKIVIHPLGDLEWKGIHTELAYLKNMFTKLEVEPQIIRHGKFKAAVEPFMQEHASPQNRLQIHAFQNAIWQNFLQTVAKARNLSEAQLNSFASNLTIESANDALNYKLVDNVMYYDEFIELLKKETAISNFDKTTLVPLSKYATTPDPTVITSNKIAVIYAEGDIVDGKGEKDNIGSEKYAKLIRDVSNDENVKAIVLRVNSPGGSALASDVIWKEIENVKRKKIPFVVSMGNLAASGGYYVSCNADKVFVNNNTITGSIGVFGLLFNAKNLFENKLGINLDTVSTNPMAGMGSVSRPLSPTERLVLQNSVERIYDTFISKVAAGRKIEKAQVDSIGQGRVWAGKDALELKLADQKGGLRNAIEFAVKKANLDKFRIATYPEQKEGIQELISQLNEDEEAKLLNTYLGQNAKYIYTLKQLKSMKGVQARNEFFMFNY